MEIDKRKVVSDRTITNSGHIIGDCITGDTIVNIQVRNKESTDSKEGMDGLADRLYKAMKKKRLCAHKIEMSIGLNRWLICDYLDGKTLPSLSDTVLLAKHLGVSLDWLVNGETNTLDNLASDMVHLEKRVKDLESIVSAKDDVKKILNN